MSDRTFMGLDNSIFYSLGASFLPGRVLRALGDDTVTVIPILPDGGSETTDVRSLARDHSWNGRARI